MSLESNLLEITHKIWNRRKKGAQKNELFHLFGYLPAEREGVLELVGGVANPRRQGNHRRQPKIEIFPQDPSVLFLFCSPKIQFLFYFSPLSSNNSPSK